MVPFVLVYTHLNRQTLRTCYEGYLPVRLYTVFTFFINRLWISCNICPPQKPASCGGQHSNIGGEGCWKFTIVLSMVL